MLTENSKSWIELGYINREGARKDPKDPVCGLLQIPTYKVNLAAEKTAQTPCKRAKILKKLVNCPTPKREPWPENCPTGVGQVEVVYCSDHLLI